MSHLLDGLLTVPPLIAYLLIGLLVFGEAAVFVGFVLPGETAVVLGGVLAARHQIDIVALCILVVACAVVGDSVGFEVGRHFGDRVLNLRPLRRHERRLDAARSFLRHRGAYAVFLGRWTAFLRAVMPGLAGLSRMTYSRFLFFNALGGLVWGITFCLVGYLAGASYARIEKRVGTVGAGVTAVVVVIGLLAWHRHRRRDSRPAVTDDGTGDDLPAPAGFGEPS
ncbi:MAG TPA: DedA family protein [Kineosporiaceae bacterium]|nr:DedA family protein [Kineosporiaceae bacterium]